MEGPLMESVFERVANAISHAMGRPLAFILCLTLVIAWAVTGPLFHFSDTWQLVINTGTTIITFLMVFLIQNSQNREGEALQTKLDELIRAVNAAENRFIGLERRSEREITEMRSEVQAAAGPDQPSGDEPGHSGKRNSALTG
jgi:low affinity Fe/Cu permease